MAHEEGFSPDWLRLREPFDHAARSVELADRFARHLPDHPSVLELGCGLGSGLRFVAPRLRTAAHWCLVDHDPRLLSAAGEAVSLWAAHHPHHAPCSLELRAHDLRDGVVDGPWDAVVTQALLDLVSDAWLVALADWLAARRLPFLAALTVDGRVHWQPARPEDESVQAAFRAHQRLDRGFGASPGFEATPRMASLLEARGYAVTLTPADWQIEATHTHMLESMVDGTADAARVTHPEPAVVDRWHRQRRADVAAGSVALTVGHLDLLALPPALQH